MVRVVVVGGQATVERLRDASPNWANDAIVCASASEAHLALQRDPFDLAVVDLSLESEWQSLVLRVGAGAGSQPARTNSGEVGLLRSRGSCSPGQFSAVELFDNERIVVVNGAQKRLRDIECRILRCVVNGGGQVVTWETIERSVWKESASTIDARSTRRRITSRDSHVSHLRATLGAEAWRLETVRGLGLRWLSEHRASTDVHSGSE